MTKEILLDIQRQYVKCQQDVKRIDNIFTIIFSKKTLSNNVYIKELEKEVSALKQSLVNLNAFTTSLDSNLFKENSEEAISTVKSKNIDLSTISPIDLLGLGETVFTLFKKGTTSKEISKILTLEAGQKITENDVSKWLKHFNNLSLSQKGRVFCQGSVFDAKESYQDIYELLHSLKNVIENENDSIFLQARTTKAQVMLELTRELRQLVKTASDLTSKVELYERMKKFQSTILEVIHKRYPTVASDIIELLVERKLIEGNLSGF